MLIWNISTSLLFYVFGCVSLYYTYDFRASNGICCSQIPPIWFCQPLQVSLHASPYVFLPYCWLINYFVCFVLYICTFKKYVSFKTHLVFFFLLHVLSESKYTGGYYPMGVFTPVSPNKCLPNLLHLQCHSWLDPTYRHEQYIVWIGLELLSISRHKIHPTNIPASAVPVHHLRLQVSSIKDEMKNISGILLVLLSTSHN